MLGKSGQNDVQFPWGYFVASLLPIGCGWHPAVLRGAWVVVFDE